MLLSVILYPAVFFVFFALLQSWDKLFVCLKVLYQRISIRRDYYSPKAKQPKASIYLLEALFDS